MVAVALGLSVFLSVGFLSLATLAGRGTSASLNDSTTTRPELVLQTGHSKGVNCSVFGPDGSWLASGGSDNAIKIWQVASGRELRALTGHTGYVKSLATSRNGQWLASGSSDRTVRIWDVATGRELFSLPGHTSSIEALAFSPDNRWLASGSADKTVKVWNLTNGKEIKTLNDHTERVTALAISGDGKLLASGSADTVVKLWDTSNWRIVRTLRKQTGKITALAFSSDSGRLASGSSDGTVCLWPTESDRERFNLKHNMSSVIAVAFGSGGALISAHQDGGIEFWNTNTGKEGRAIPGDANAEQLVFAAFSPSADTLALGAGDRVVNLRKLTGGEETRTLESHSTAFNAVDFSRDGRWFASAANDSSIRLWQVATGRELPRLSGHMGFVNTVTFSPDGHLLASGSASGEVKVWDLSTGRLAFNLPSSPKSINIVAFSPDGKFLASAGMQQTVEIWDLDTKRARTLTGHTQEVTSVVFSINGQLLASAGRDKTVRVWDLKTGSVIRTLDNLGAEINSLALNPDVKLLAAANADKTVRLWEFSTGVPLQTLSGHSDEVLKVTFSPDGQLLASASSDRSVKIWDVKSGAEPRGLRGGSEKVNGVTFSSDGRWIISASEDGSMTVSTTTGTLVATLVPVANSDDWLVVTPDGLFDGSPDSWNLLLWRFGGDTFNALPVEAYFNEFYYPGVLADIFGGKDPKAPQDIAQKDRRQPRVAIALSGNSTGKIATREVTIKLEITDAEPDKQHALGCGARDLRLFRNGLLVKTWPDDVLKGARKGTVEATIPVIAGENRLSVYAFNNDNIKSGDASLSLSGADNLKRMGTAYVLAIGVEQYENPQYDLHYPVADATEMGGQLKDQQERIGRYNPIVTISLFNAEATRANILLALKRLAGSDIGPLPPTAPRALAKINQAQPEDAVIIYFSGHGAADHDRFYLIPHDLGYRGERTSLEGFKTILAHSISDRDLEGALKDLEANQILLLIDACKSGQALKSEEQRRGPMNTRGLAQLAYEKGMYILTASQSDEVAFESEKLKHSYLAYALLEDGIKKGLADLDGDRQILLQEWFAYATEHVPQIRRDRKGSKELIEDEPDEQKVQRPRVFYTRQVGAERLIIAKVGNATSQ
ncbi:MAG TPA: caspase family protein [Blastocatellia bacterium]|nr:caspase family protein [Blastocatellia bacterium]